MTVYLISYDLNKSDKNYEGVIKAIKSASTNDIWCKPLKSVFLIHSHLSANQISENIKAQADVNDEWLVIEVNNNSQGWIQKDLWDYITKMF